MVPIAEKLTPTEALVRARRYCAYRERCHQEVRQKLFEFGLWTREVDQAIAVLIDEGFLNEERFARAYARGHFYQKQWGRVKISHELKLRGINERLVKTALTEIDGSDYRKTIVKLIGKKSKELRGTRSQRTPKLLRFMRQKGYEVNLVLAILQEEKE